MHCIVIYRWSRGCWDRKQFIIFLLAVLTVPTGRGSLELLDSREMSVHKCCEKQRETEDRAAAEREIQWNEAGFFTHANPITHTWKEQTYTLLIIIQKVTSQTPTKLSLTSSIIHKHIIL